VDVSGFPMFMFIEEKPLLRSFSSVAEEEGF
jgi:hypothetical protein